MDDSRIESSRPSSADVLIFSFGFKKCLDIGFILSLESWKINVTNIF